MALSEQARNVMFRYFSGTEPGEEVTSQMLSYVPARDVEEPVTKNDLRTELAALRLEFRTELDEAIGGLRNELRSESGELRTGLKSEIRALRSEMGEMRSESRSEIDALRSDMHQMLYALLGTMVALFAIGVTLVLTLG